MELSSEQQEQMVQAALEKLCALPDRLQQLAEAMQAQGEAIGKLAASNEMLANAVNDLLASGMEDEETSEDPERTLDQE